MSAPVPFRLTDDLPTGVTVLEASAGTGKTYAIAGLVVRYVAEGMRLPQLLVVTFTRAATAELRDRVRRRLVGVAAHLDGVLAGGGRDSDDEVAAHLAQGDPGTVRDRLGYLNHALTEFDAATIATIHGFCQHVLHGVGLASDVERDAEFLEDQAELLDTVVDDVYVRTFRELGEVEGAPSRGDLRQIAEAVVANPDAEIVPGGAEDRWVALRVRLAHEIRAEVERRKRGARLLSYDDLLTRLAATLRDPLRGPAARRRLREQYRVALVDEFQDTDPIQWEILARTFGGADPATLVLIGDPKQAIYSFRGADVYAYLQAAGAAATQRTLVTNWRSDGGLLDAYNLLFDGAAFGDDRIPYRVVAPPGHHRDSRLVGGDETPLQIRVVTREAEGVRFYTRGGRRIAVADSAREHLARDLSGEIVSLLRSAPTLVERAPDGSERKQPLRPGDVAVLARTNDEAARVQRALHDVGVPAIINGVGSVFETPAATAWQRLLEAIERPSSPARVRVAALTPFVGWSAERLADADEEEIDELRARLHRWADILRDHSVASLLRTIVWEQRLPARLLGLIGGDRLLTDLEHVGELLHATATAEELGPTALAGWLREQMAAATEEKVPPEERARRLESDAEAVQVLTIHRSKGLEFPVVYCPFLWSGGGGRIDVPLCHPDGTARRVADVGGRSHPAFQELLELAEREQLGEAMRLLYVALTRARHRAVVWWAPVMGSERSPLGRVLFCRGSNGQVLSLNSKAIIPSDDEAFTRLGALADRTGGTIAVSPTRTVRSEERWDAPPAERLNLDVAPFDREIDRSWHRTSYSRLTELAHEPRIGSERPEAVKDDERLPAGISGGDADAEAGLRAVPLPLGGLPAGTAFGTFVHAVLEEADFDAADLDAELTRQVEEQRRRSPVDVGDVGTLVDGLRRVLETPLGPLAGGARLGGTPRGRRLDELTFELPIAGGDSPTGEVTLAGIGRLLETHLAPDEPLAAYAERLREPALQRAVRGYLTGSIDLVLRLESDGEPRFLVADHKTNRLAPPDEELSAWHYRPAALVEAMSAGHYPLQALLYTVALHRFLRWRLRAPDGSPSYDPERHLGGVLYLFLRGMTGAKVPHPDGHPCGVFSWRPPTPLVVAVSDLLDRGEAT